MASTNDNPVVNAESRVATVYGICAAFSTVSVVAVALRTYTRVYLLRRPGADDVTIVAAEVHYTIM
jgi:hypothetical protein